MNLTWEVLPYYPWWPRDFRASTIGWPVMAKYIMRELLDCQWLMLKLPLDLGELARACDVPRKTFTKYWKSHVRRRFPRVRGGFQNARLEIVRAEIRARTHAHAENGRKGGLASGRNRAPRHVGDLLKLPLPDRRQQ